MRVLILGHDGRASALCHHLLRSKDILRLWCWPGNASLREQGLTLTGIDDFDDFIINGFDIEIEEEEEEEEYHLADIYKQNLRELKELEENEEEIEYREGDPVYDEDGNPVLCDDNTPMIYPWFIPPKEPEPDPEPFEPQRKLHQSIPELSDEMIDRIRSLNPIIIPTALEYCQSGIASKLRQYGLTVLGPDVRSFQLEEEISNFRDLCANAGIKIHPFVRSKRKQDIIDVYKAYPGDAFRILANSPHCTQPPTVCHGAGSAINVAEGIFADETYKQDHIILEPYIPGHFAHASFFFDGKECRTVAMSGSYEVGKNATTEPLFYPSAYFSPATGCSVRNYTRISEDILPAIGRIFRDKRLYLRGMFIISFLVTNTDVYVYNIHTCPPDGLYQHAIHILQMKLKATTGGQIDILRYYSNCCYSQLNELGKFSRSSLRTISVAGHANCFPLKPIAKPAPELNNFDINAKMLEAHQSPIEKPRPLSSTALETGFTYFEPKKECAYSSEAIPLWLTQTGDDVADVYNDILEAMEKLPDMENITYNIYLEDFNKTIQKRYRNTLADDNNDNHSQDNSPASSAGHYHNYTISEE